MITTKDNSKSDFGIIAPIGGFGNHVRWLMLLDPRYQFTLRSGFLTQQKYESIKGINWPQYDDYLNLNFKTYSEEIKSEILNFSVDIFSYPATILEFDNLNSKLDSFKNSIYSKHRTWHNWLLTEWKYRDYLNTFVNFEHNKNFLSQKTLALTIDPEIAYRCYLKLNSNLANRSPENFITQVKQYEKISASANIKILDSGILYQPILDRNFYNEMIDWFGLLNLYDEANYIHSLWYQAHRRAEAEFVQDISKFYSHYI